MKKLTNVSVFVVWRGCINDKSIGKIFFDVKRAEEYANALERNREAIGEDVYIEEFKVE